ncbi:hypothetical protein LCGC14_1754910 [marine sediment metagenome]|uniref:Uncharacterized protein n=1 Tax=marine sediment metagenome TaxID=412755 RepID=A0A0F9JHY8_9ZZZZ
MNITAGLKQVKQLKNELKRKIKMRQDNFYVIIPKDGKLEDISGNDRFVSFENVSGEIKIIAEKISVLREKIMKTNIQTIVNVENADISLGKLKLLVDDIRSELAQLASVKERDIFSSRRRRIATTEEKEKEIAQLTDMQLEALILQLEDKKMKLENILEVDNANTQLVE